MFSKTYAFDAATGLLKRDAAQAALTADAWVGTQWDQGSPAATDIIAIINIESVDIANSDETYEFLIVGSQTSDRSDAQILGRAKIGDAAAIAIETVDAAAGDRVEIRCRTEIGLTKFQYVDLYLDVSGTSPSVGFSAYISKEM
ncbi:MAG: hypothetical protein Unbinned5081contig1001_5 [Prokaryotic dsDNA virus sp.]|nr:MAG: hypothetical protein Unbinned5081contig1001_5 [Prokaryotic dsDNA virus sp.]|tara:strand:+ start:305 stop:736 length:432 start_codon:yes stop_codon:yes gene_type:complete